MRVSEKNLDLRNSKQKPEKKKKKPLPNHFENGVDLGGRYQNEKADPERDKLCIDWLRISGIAGGGRPLMYFEWSEVNGFRVTDCGQGDNMLHASMSTCYCAFILYNREPYIYTMIYN